MPASTSVDNSVRLVDLPIGTVIVDRCGLVLQKMNAALEHSIQYKCSTAWYTPGSEDPILFGNIRLPVQVISIS